MQYPSPTHSHFFSRSGSCAEAHPDADIPPAAPRTQAGFETVGNSGCTNWRHEKTNWTTLLNRIQFAHFYEEPCAGGGFGSGVVCARSVGHRSVIPIFLRDAAARPTAKPGRPGHLSVKCRPVAGQ